MIWTETAISQNKHNYSTFKSEIVTDNLAKYLPQDKFVLGLYNNGKPRAVAEYWVHKYIVQGNFEKVKQLIIENGEYDID